MKRFSMTPSRSKHFIIAAGLGQPFAGFRLKVRNFLFTPAAYALHMGPVPGLFHEPAGFG
jgi:hypothetical protein